MTTNAHPSPAHAPAGSPAHPEAIDPKTGLTVAELQRHAQKVSAAAAAAADPLPGALADAFPTHHIEVAGIRLRPIVLGDFALLRALDSPVMRQMMEVAKPRELRRPTEFSDQDSYDLIFQFTRPCAEAEEVLATGLEHYRRLAKEFAHKLNPFIGVTVVQAIGEEMKRSYLTALKYQPAGGESGETFTPPPPASTTASAGGSTASAVSCVTIPQ